MNGFAGMEMAGIVIDFNAVRSAQCAVRSARERITECNFCTLDWRISSLKVAPSFLQFRVVFVTFVESQSVIITIRDVEEVFQNAQTIF